MTSPVVRRALLCAVAILSLIGYAVFVDGVRKAEHEARKADIGINMGAFRVQYAAGAIFLFAHIIGIVGSGWERMGGASMFSTALSTTGSFALVPTMQAVHSQLKRDVVHGAIEEADERILAGGTLLLCASFSLTLTAARARRANENGVRRVLALAVPLVVASVLCGSVFLSASYAAQEAQPVATVGAYSVAAALMALWLLASGAWRSSPARRCGVAVYAANFGLLSLRSGLGASPDELTGDITTQWPAASIVFGVAALLVAVVLPFYLDADNDDDGRAEDGASRVLRVGMPALGALLALVGAVMALAALDDVDELLARGMRPQFICTSVFAIVIGVLYVLGGALRRPALAAVAFSMSLDNSWHTAHFAGVMHSALDFSPPHRSAVRAAEGGAVLMLIAYGLCVAVQARRGTGSGTPRNKLLTAGAIVGITFFIIGAVGVLGAIGQTPSPTDVRRALMAPSAAGWATQGFICALLLLCTLLFNRGPARGRWAACAAVLLALKVNGFFLTLVGPLDERWGHATFAPYRVGHAFMLVPCLVLGPVYGVVAARMGKTQGDVGMSSYVQHFG